MSFGRTGLIIAAGAVPCTIVWAGGIAIFFEHLMEGALFIVAGLVVWLIINLKKSRRKCLDAENDNRPY